MHNDFVTFIMYLFLGVIILSILALLIFHLSKIGINKTSLNFTRSNFEQNKTPQIIIGEKGEIVIANRMAKEIINSRKCFYDLIHQDDVNIEKYYHKLRKVNSTLAPQNYILELKNKDNKYINFMILADQITSSKTVLSLININNAVNKKQTEFEECMEEYNPLADDIVVLLVEMLNTQDPYICNHQKNVAEIAEAISKEMNLSEEIIKNIYISGLLHDIGKISVPQSILSKPAKLSEQEFDLVKEHPKIGYKILRKHKFFWPISDIIIQHHERINGSGYPYGLKENQICLEAKILAVADVVDAISSHRPYRPALGFHQAVKEITQQKGIIYEASVVEACLKILNIDLKKNRLVRMLVDFTI